MRQVDSYLMLAVSTMLAAGLAVVSSTYHEAILPDHLLETIPTDHLRFKRSVEGAPCVAWPGGTGNSIYFNSAGVAIALPSFPSGGVNDSCVFNGLPNTRCNSATGKCECDPAVATRLNVLPNAAICLPLAYVNNTNGLCLPSLPDMCATLVAGSYCASVQTAGTTARQLKCVCRAGTGIWPNCNAAKIGSPCQNSTVCRNQIGHSYCSTITNGFGTCQCPSQGTTFNILVSGTLTAFVSPQTTVPNLSQTECVPVFCPTVPAVSTTPAGQIQPCQGDNLSPPVTPDAEAFTCTNSTLGYQCTCKAGYKGRAHNSTTIGRCCNANHIACADFSKCLVVESLCDGVADCNDCSDEKLPFCSGAWPTSPSCGLANRSVDRSGDVSFNNLKTGDAGQPNKPKLSSLTSL